MVRSSRIWVAILGLPLCAGVLLGAVPARAHAVVIQSTPAINAAVAPGTVAVTLRFNSRIDHRRSRLTLIPAGGAPHPLQEGPVTEPDVMTTEMTDLAAGEYRLRWQVLAVDGHITRGDIPFSVKAP